jgi:hypothetical protein
MIWSLAQPGTDLGDSICRASWVWEPAELGGGILQRDPGRDTARAGRRSAGHRPPRVRGARWGKTATAGAGEQARPRRRDRETKDWLAAGRARRWIESDPNGRT